MRGQLVLVRAFGGEPQVRRIWDADDDVAVVTDDEQFQRLHEGREGLAATVHREDVFCYDPAAAQRLISEYKKRRKATWNGLKKWAGGSTPF